MIDVLPPSEMNSDGGKSYICLTAKEFQQLGQLGGQRRDRHNQREHVADGHAEAQCGGLFVAFIDVLAPQQQQGKQPAEGGGDGRGDIGHEDQLGGGTAVAVAHHCREGQAGQTAKADKFALQADILLKPGAQQHHAPLGVGQQRGEARAYQGQAHDVPRRITHDGHQHLRQLSGGFDGQPLGMKHHGTHQDDGPGDQDDTDDVDQGVGEHNAVEQVLLLPLLLLTQVGGVNACGDGRVGGDEGQRCTQAALRDAEAYQSLAHLAPVRAAYPHQGGVEGYDHHQNAQRDDLLHLGVHIFGKVAVEDNGKHNGRADLPVDTENQVHPRPGAGNVAHGKKQAGQEHRHAYHAGGHRPVIFPDGVDGRQAADNGQPVGGEHKGNAHKDDGDKQPHQLVAVVRAQHGGGGHRAGADDDAGGDQAGADPLHQIFQGEPLDVFTKDGPALSFLAHKHLRQDKRGAAPKHSAPNSWECDVMCLLVLLHIHLGQLAALQAQSHPVLLLLVQGQNGLAHEGVGEDTPLIQGLLQPGVGLAGGLAAAIDGLGDMVDAVGPVLGLLQGVLVGVGEHLAGGADQLGHTSSEADEGAVHAGEPADAQCLVMAGDEGDIRALLAEQAHVVLIDGGDAGAHLDALHMVDFLAHLDEGFHRVERLGGGGVQVDDDVDVGALGHVLDVLEGGVGVHAEAQPHMGGHEQDAVGAGGLGLGGHFDGLLRVLAVDTGDDGHDVAALLGADFHHTLALGPGQAGDLTSVAVAHQALDALAVEALDPAQIDAELSLIDGVVVVQGNGYRRENGLEGFDFSHDKFLLLLKI